MSQPRRGWITKSAPRDDGWLSIVEVSERDCVLSNGDTLLIRWAKLHTQCEQLCEARAAIWIRTWPSYDRIEKIEKPELIEVRGWSDGDPDSKEVF
jgi:hypothetical protein